LISGGLLLNLLSKANKQQILALTIFFSFSFIIIYSQIFGQLGTFPPFYLIRTAWRGDFFMARYFAPLVIFYVATLVLLSNKNKKFLENDSSRVFLNLLPFTHAVSLTKVGEIFRENPTWYWVNFPINVDFVLMLGLVGFFIFVLITTKILHSIH